MNAEKIYEKAEKRLTISGKCGTIFKQSAQTASHLRWPQGSRTEYARVAELADAHV